MMDHKCDGLAEANRESFYDIAIGFIPKRYSSDDMVADLSVDDEENYTTVYIQYCPFCGVKLVKQGKE